eukprot:6722832-Lingulodinium_polyedra.AAC.1
MAPGVQRATDDVPEEVMPEIPPEVKPAGPEVPPLEHPPVGTNAPLAGCIGFDAVGPDGQLRPVRV